MNSKEKITIFPYDIEASPIVRYNNMLKGLQISRVATAKGWSVDAKNAKCVDGGTETEYIVCSDVLECLKDSDTLLVLRPFYEINYNTIIKPVIDLAINQRKNIIMTYPVENDELMRIESECLNKGVYFKQSKSLYSVYDLDASKSTLRRNNSIIVFVLGTTERTHKFHIQLALRECFVRDGYFVSQIGSRDYCEIFGFHSFPSFMFDTSISEVHKILKFNNYIKDIEERENPDVIIIGIPGGIMKINDVLHNNFGILAYEVSQAILPDVVILSTLYEDYKNEFFYMLNETVKHKFGFEIDCYNISNTQLDWINAKEQNKMIYTTLDYQFIDKAKQKYQKLSTPVYNIMNGVDGYEMYKFIINRLSVSTIDVI